MLLEKVKWKKEKFVFYPKTEVLKTSSLSINIYFNFFDHIIKYI